MLYLIFFLLEVYILMRSEKRRWKNLLTPLNVLMLPYTLATIIAIIVSYTNKDIPNFYFPSLIVWMFGLIFFFIPSYLISNLSKNIPEYVALKETKSDDSFNLLKWIALVCIAVSMSKLSSMSSSFDSFGTDEFSEQYETTGFFNHLAVLLSAIFGYSIYKLDLHKHIITIPIIACALVGMYAVGTKSWIIAPFLIGYYARLLTGKTTFSYRTTLLPVIIIIGIFFLSYFLTLVLASGNELDLQLLNFLVNHFTNYFSGSTLSFSIDFQKGILEPDMTASLFAPPLNIINVLIGEKYVSFINPVQMDIGDLGETNVRTYFGTIYAYSHSVVTLVLIPVIWSIVTNAIYLWAKKSRSLFVLLANCANMAILTFGFFDFFWITLTPYEILAIYLLMNLFLYRRRVISVYAH